MLGIIIVSITLFLPNDIPLRVLQALAMVESSGNGWENDENGNLEIKIRFENHIFLSKCVEGKSTFFVGNPSWTDHTMLSEDGLVFVHESQQTERKALKLAASICPTAAYEAISIGTFQLHAMNYKVIGFPFPSLMLSYMSESPEREMEVFKRYLRQTPALYHAMVAQDLDEIAYFWNPHNEAWKSRFEEAWNSLGED